MKVEQAKKEELTLIKKLLNNSNLLSDDLDLHIDSCMVIKEDDKIVATGALELYTNEALLRSVAVDTNYRNSGFGTAICNELRKLAKVNNVSKLFLLTETAEEYFKKAGFTNIERDKTPQSIQSTQQFSSLCPSSATVMVKVI